MPRAGFLLGLMLLAPGCGPGVLGDPGAAFTRNARAENAQPPSVSRPARRGCTSIVWCKELARPDGPVICKTDHDRTCSEAERIFECEEDALSVCGPDHARPIHYRPPIGGRSTEISDAGADAADARP